MQRYGYLASLAIVATTPLFTEESPNRRRTGSETEETTAPPSYRAERQIEHLAPFRPL